MNVEFWPQVLTIVLSNLGMFLWATRQARSDYLHIDKKFEDSRKELAAMMANHIKNTEEMMKRMERVKK